MTTLQPYPDYKDSGIRWLGEVPTHWTKVSIGTISQLINGFPFDSSLFDPNDGTPLIRIRDLNSSSTSVRYRGQVVESALVKTGDLIIGMDGDFNVALWRGEHALLNQRMCSLHPKTQTDVRFLAYLLPTPLQQINDQTHATTVKHLSSGQVRSIRVCSPPLDEQRAIADYLDAMDAKITRFIAARRRMIVLLEEQKGAIINQAITRGLDPDVPLKPSGIDWLGEVPAHWEVRRIKSIAQETDMRTQTGTEDLLSLRMREGLIPHNTASEKPINAESLVGYKRVLPGQLVMNRMRASVGLFAVSNHKGLVSPDYAVYTLETNVDADFLVQLLKTPMMRSEFRRRSTGLGTGESGFLRLYSDDFGNVLIALPGTDEQRRLVREIRSNTGNVDRIAKRTQREIELVHEYHTRLISDVVTGQLDVRGVDLPAVKEVVDASVESIAAEWQPVGEVVE